MIGNYEIVNFFNSDLIKTYHWKYGTQCWAKANMTKRHKGDKCKICEETVGSVAFKPITNGYNRADRICIKHYSAKLEIKEK